MSSSAGIKIIPTYCLKRKKSIVTNWVQWLFFLPYRLVTHTENRPQQRLHYNHNVRARGEQKTRPTKNNMEKNGGEWREKITESSPTTELRPTFCSRNVPYNTTMRSDALDLVQSFSVEYFVIWFHSQKPASLQLYTTPRSSLEQIIILL